MDKAKLTEAMKAEAGMSISAGARAVPVCPWCAQPNNLKAQRDALLAACEAALSVMRSPEYGGAPGTTRAVSDLVAALALAKPNQQGEEDGP